MYLLSLLPFAVLAAVPLALTTPLSPRWDDMRVKHVWGSIPEKWECQGHPPVGTTMDLRIALKPHRENALIEVLYEVSNPNHSKYVSVPLILCVTLLKHSSTCAMLQIRCALVQGASCRACRSSSRHTRTSWFLACAPRGSIFCGLDHAWRELVDNLQSVPDQSKYPPWCIIPTLSPHRDERDRHSHDWIFAARCLARPRADGRTNNVLRFATCPPTDVEIGV
jgi:hypothetical protein